MGPSGVVWRAAVAGVLYLVSALLSVQLGDIAGTGAVFWPAAGIAVTALLVWDRRAWPAILVAVAVAELTANLILGFSVPVALLWVTSNVLEVTVIAVAVARAGATTLDTPARVGAFVAIAFVGGLLGGLIGAIGTVIDVGTVTYPVVVLRWMIGDALGVITVVPLGLVVFGLIPRVVLRGWRGPVIALSSLGTALLVFAVADEAAALTAGVLLLLPLMWAAVQGGVSGGALAAFVVTQVTAVGASLGYGPFAAAALSALQRSLQLQLFLAIVTVVTLVLAARTSESAAYQRLAELRAQLIAVVSHELRTPLTPIVGFAELLLTREPGLTATGRTSADAIRRNAEHLTTVIDDLLQLSRARRGPLPTQPQLLVVVPWLAALLEARQDTEVLVDAGDPEATVVCDPGHLTQVLTNLLDNAYAHGRPPIRIRVATDGARTRVHVMDDGDGVPAWFVPRMFDEFTQPTEGDRRTSSGLGLGLSIARELARANGGELSYRASGGGARFVIDLPAHQAAPPG